MKFFEERDLNVEALSQVTIVECIGLNAYLPEILDNDFLNVKRYIPQDKLELHENFSHQKDTIE